MGVDVELFVWTARELSDRDILDLSYRAVEALGRDLFWLDVEEKRHAFVRESDPGYSLASWDSGRGTLIKLNSLARYYGPGYERGPFPEFFMLWQWLRINLEGCVIWYGGDCSDMLERLTEAREHEILVHWATKGHQPYRGYPGSQNSTIPSKIVLPTCSLCERGMIRYGWGGGGAVEYAAVACPCGADLVSRDGGQTWIERKGVK